MSKDSRGVLRGRCTLCQCVQYTRQTADQLLCSSCSHVPAKHLKLDPTSVTPFPGQSFGGHDVSRPTPQYGSQYAVSATAAPYTPPQQHYTNSAPFLKNCAADGCTNKVHYDAELGPFDYCSPGCRDRHLLPLERDRLKRDIEENSTKMATYLPQNSPPLSGTASTAATDDDDKKKKNLMVSIEKRPKEELGLITADVRPGNTLRIVGVELGSPAHRELKEGHIKLLDIIAALNEDDIFSREWFRQSTRDKTKPLLTLLRNQKTPSIKSLLSKVKDRCPLATHVRVAINPVFIHVSDFGIEPFKTTTLQGLAAGFFLGVREEDSCSAHLSGITIKDRVLMYATMNSKMISDGKIPISEDDFKTDISKARKDGKHLVFVLRRYSTDY